MHAKGFDLASHERFFFYLSFGLVVVEDLVLVALGLVTEDFHDELFCQSTSGHYLLDSG